MKISGLSLKLFACAVFLFGNSYFAIYESEKVRQLESEKYEREMAKYNFQISGREPATTAFDYVAITLLIPAFGCTIAAVWLRKH